MRFVLHAGTGSEWDFHVTAAANYPRRRTSLSVRTVEGETVVLDRREGLIHRLNPSAACVWNRCDGTASQAELAQQMTEGYDIDLETAARDVATVLGQLRRLNLLQVTTTDAARSAM